MSLLSHPPSGPGFIYFIRNPSIPNEYKIGYSIDPIARAKQLSSTGLSADLFVHRVLQVQNMIVAERTIHSFYDASRITPDKEWFYIVSPNQAYQLNINCIEMVEWDQLTEWLNIHIDQVIEGFQYAEIDFTEISVQYLEQMHAQSSANRFPDWR
ncbi:GIY-YIG nuclease family protein [Shewanella colwelliana]|uniref:GIY-YIG nuclease family protein n=1 Tax=Shewanella colwelliana TaxID=23 RepID=UPI0022AE7AC6|nr:GIY-YIG nuclease family protein [Shewanella colwelliana]MCZ4337665.1 GIY-YIG nuclease family protein [Shewanella colwelliana]